MKTAFLMVILSMLDNGQLSSAYVNTPSETSCKQRSNIVRAILTKGGVDIREIKCVASPLKFEKFDHKTAANAPRYFYSISLDGTSTTITKLDDLIACKKQQADTKPANKARLFCTSSTQKMQPPKTKQQ